MHDRKAIPASVRSSAHSSTAIPGGANLIIRAPGPSTTKATAESEGIPVSTTVYRRDPEKVAKLSPEQYKVTQEAATEQPFHNEYWDNRDAGLYVDIVSGEPLFASINKVDSATGWPSFSVPIDPANVVLNEDRSYGMVRTEVRSKHGDSHLGHVFDDGPAADGGSRFCINSAALRFVPLDELEAAGYGEFRSLFPTQAAS
jgi:peptide-methionine (R)-S-oxide reductase